MAKDLDRRPLIRSTATPSSNCRVRARPWPTIPWSWHLPPLTEAMSASVERWLSVISLTLHERVAFLPFEPLTIQCLTTPVVHFIPRIIGFIGHDPFPPPTTAGEATTAKRRSLVLSGKALAMQLGVDEWTISKIEGSGLVSRPKVAVLLRRILRA